MDCFQNILFIKQPSFRKEPEATNPEKGFAV
jgi:hypothetical protein